MNIPTPKPGKRYSYLDYKDWPDGERWEIIDGVPYLLSPAPSTEHQRILTELILQLGQFLRDKSCRVFPAPFDVRLGRPKQNDEEIDTVVQPDIVVVCDPDKLDHKGCNGAPDIVIEILSQATAKRDLHDKFMAYERSGVKQYWVVFPWDKALDIYMPNDFHKFEIVGKYQYPDKFKVDYLGDLKIDLELVFRI